MPKFLSALRSCFAPAFPAEWNELDMRAFKVSLDRAGGELGGRDLARLLGRENGLPLLQAFARQADQLGLPAVVLAGESREAFLGAAWLADAGALPCGFHPERKQENWALTLAAQGHEPPNPAHGISLTERFARLARSGCSLNDALGHAIAEKHFETVLPLVEAGALVSVTDIEGSNVFHTACSAPGMSRERLVEAVIKLVEAGAPASCLNEANARNLTPLSLAEEKFPGFGTALRAAATAGAQSNPHCQYLLGQLIRSGLVKPQDWGPAQAWLRQAAEAGVPRAQYAMGVLCLEDSPAPDYPGALKWIRLAAEKNLPAALYSLGHMHLLGEGVPQDLNEARRCLGLAASLGDAKAQYRLGREQLRYKSLQENLSSPWQYLSRAARQGNVDAQLYLGRVLLRRADSRWLDEAVSWLRRVGDNLSLNIASRIDANVDASSALGRMAGRTRAAQQVRAERVRRLCFALESSLANAPTHANPIRSIAQSLLNIADPGQTHFNLNGAPVARSEIESLTRANNTRAVLEGAYRMVQQGWAANVHLEGFMVQGTRLLEAITARNQVAPPSIDKTRAEIETALAAMPDIAEAARKGLEHMLALPEKVNESGLKTTTKETLRQMWAYVCRQDDAMLRQNLTRSFMSQLAAIGREKVCNTGCVQRILQTPEGIDFSLSGDLPDEAALKDEMLSLAAEVNTEIEECSQLDYEGQEADPDAVTRIKEDMIRARIEARFVQVRGLPKDAVDKVAGPVIDSVQYL